MVFAGVFLTEFMAQRTSAGELCTWTERRTVPEAGFTDHRGPANKGSFLETDLLASSFRRLDMPLFVAEAFIPNTPSQLLRS